ncbi:serine/threonine-protein phosphatase 6 regulatory ankyrin repeat subunit B-like isoform X2 [Trichogramma pretiosum]|uniref:serine/threonine-protein phosphatase 6 regulatory ankyrin repeat subunit B-like isoform X2 n=1 Tax=Trichogramma pretiosum TaxID=7493 RepID=UPI000C718B17|nr:serine/threonine-protein phosphatase 6 regulatory ankyrin repeat subunit B-like isoform X2 [Trichogramma pretiosum]
MMSTSNNVPNKRGESFVSESDDCRLKHVDDFNQKQLQNLKKVRVKTGWTNWFKKGRHRHLDQLYPLISDWRGPLPDLRDIFPKKKIEFLLKESINCMYENPHDNRGKRFIEFVARSGYKDMGSDINIVGKLSQRRSTPLHHVAELLDDRGRDVARELFTIYDRFFVNYIDKSGFTHFHVACRYGFDDLVEKFLEHGQDPNCLDNVKGNSSLILALKYGHVRVAETLLRKCADPHLANFNKSTPLHVACQVLNDNDDFIKKFFLINDVNRRTVRIDAQNKWGLTPLHIAVSRNSVKLVEFLLRRGANPNISDVDGLTPLHIICQTKCSDDLAKMFFEIIDEIHQSVQVDARDRTDSTPLCHAVSFGHKTMVELLLRRGADPHWTDDFGLTPVSFCLEEGTEDLVKLFFQVNDELNRHLQINDAWNGLLMSSPLQSAVQNLRPIVFDVLLNHGADLSRFVFPSASDLVLCLNGLLRRREERPYSINFKLELASGLLSFVDSLEKREYELKRKDALTIMRLFSYYGLFKKSADVEKCWFDDEEFKSRAKELMIKPSLSLYDLIRLKPEEAAKQLTNMDYLEFARSKKLLELPEKYQEACAVHLCEKLSRRFFHCWALKSYMKLTRNRLSIPFCEMIIDMPTNQNLYNICLAALKHSSWCTYMVMKHFDLAEI